MKKVFIKALIWVGLLVSYNIINIYLAKLTGFRLGYLFNIAIIFLAIFLCKKYDAWYSKRISYDVTTDVTSEDNHPIDGWKCPICGNANEKFTKICSNCKYDVNPNGWVCPNCGEINDESTNVCKCGYEDF